MKKLVYIMTLVSLSLFVFNNSEVSAQKPINNTKGKLNLAKSSFNTNSVYKSNQEHNTFASNQRPSRYATGKKENIIQRTFERKKRYNKPPRGITTLR